MKQLKKEKIDIVMPLLILLGTLAVKLVMYDLLPEKYFYDQFHLMECLQGIGGWDSLYQAAAGFYSIFQFLGMETVKQWGWLITLLALPLLALVVFYKKSYNLAQYLFIGATFFLLAIYTFGCTKEFIQLLVFAVIYAILRAKKTGHLVKLCAVCAVLLCEGVVFRKYYAIMAALVAAFGFFYLVFFQKKPMNLKNGCLLLLLTFVSLLCGLTVLSFVRPNEFRVIMDARYSVNVFREDNPDARTVIFEPLGQNTNLLLFVGNYLINTLRMLVPVELVTKGPLQLAFIGYQLAVTATVFCAAKRMNRENYLWFAVIVGFVMTSVLLEPDFGSWVRHQSVLCLIYFTVSNLCFEKAATPQNTAEPAPEKPVDIPADKTVSVIIPVYNVKNYLDRCVASVVNQTYTKLQIILIDDGSTDGSGLLCDRWKEKDDRITVIHRANGGLPAARNSGLAIATGELIGFVDSDDYVAPDMFEYLVRAVRQYNAEIACCRFIRMLGDGRMMTLSKNKGYTVFEGTDCLREYLYGHNMEQMVWNKLYTRELLLTGKDENALMQFDETAKESEDVRYNFAVFQRLKRCVVADGAKYYYQQDRPEQITGRKVNAARVDGVYYWDKIRQVCHEKYPELEGYALRRQVYFYLGLFTYITPDSPFLPEKTKVLCFMRQHLRQLFRCGVPDPILKASTLLCCVSPGLFSFCKKCYKKFFYDADWVFRNNFWHSSKKKES